MSSPPNYGSAPSGGGTDGSQQPHDTNIGFLGDLTDGRDPGSWTTRYDATAQKLINEERDFLLISFGISLLFPLVLGVAIREWFYQEATPYLHLKRYIFGFFGGVLGGTMYSAKWLVHGVAKNTWNQDRRLWRIFTPLSSGSLAFAMLLLIDSGIMDITDSTKLNISKCYGIGFLIGYFSDNAIGKLAEVAKVFFGSTQTKG